LAGGVSLLPLRQPICLADRPRPLPLHGVRPSDLAAGRGELSEHQGGHCPGGRKWIEGRAAPTRWPRSAGQMSQRRRSISEAQAPRLLRQLPAILFEVVQP